MTYDNITVQRDSFPQIFSPYTRILILLLLLLSALFPALPLIAASLVYDPAENAHLTGFSIGRLDWPNEQTGYHDEDKHVWDNKDGYIGRLLYTGGPATFTFTNISGKPNGVNRDLFYFISSANSKYYREFFLIIRARGRFHNNAHSYFAENGKMYTIPAPITGTKTYEFKEGAGDELVGNGETGYNDAGVPGTCVIDDYGNYNEFKYRYRFSHIWLDIGQVFTRSLDSHYTGQDGYYCSSIGVSTNTGGNLILNLQGRYLSSGSSPKPMNYCLTIDKYYTRPISYNIIKDLNSKDEALDIASISYLSFDDAAKISFASNQTGATDFSFKDMNGGTIPFKLAFQSTLHAPLTVFALEEKNTFESDIIKLQSPIGDTSNTHRLEGKIKLYTEETTVTPMKGVYSSTIYILVTPKDG